MSRSDRTGISLIGVVRGMVLGTIVLACAALIALGPGPDEELPGDPQVTVLTYWEKFSGHQAAQLQEVVDEFNQTVGRQKKIFVRHLSVGDVTQKTLTATAAGVPPDLAGTWDAYLSAYAALDALEPLDAMAAEHGITADRYKPVFWKGCLYRGRLYALPSVGWVTALIYNKRIFHECSDELRARQLDPNQPPRTLQELDQYAAVLNTRDDRGHIDRAGYLPLYPGFHIAHAPFWFGGQLYDADRDRLTLTDPSCVRAFQWVRDYSQRLGADSMMEFRSGLGGHSSAQNPFLAGKIAMCLERPFIAGQIETFKPSMNHWVPGAGQPATHGSPGSLEARQALCEWGAAPFPSAVKGQENVCFAGFDAVVIPRGAKHPRESFEFLAYLNRPEVAERLASLHCTNSVQRKTSEPFRLQHPNPYIEVFETLAASENAKGLPPIAIWPEVGGEMGVVAESVYLMEKTPEQALSEAQARLTARYDDFRRIQAQRRGH